MQTKKQANLKLSTLQTFDTVYNVITDPGIPMTKDNVQAHKIESLCSTEKLQTLIKIPNFI